MESRPSGDLTDRLTTRFEHVVIHALVFLQVVMITLITVYLFVLFAVRVGPVMSGVQDMAELQNAVQNGFGGVLLVLLGLELLETLRTYFVERRLRLEVVLTVAFIALGRHIIQLDYHEVTGMELLGISSLVLALSTGYFLLRKSLLLPSP